MAAGCCCGEVSPSKIKTDQAYRRALWLAVAVAVDATIFIVESITARTR